MKRPVISKELKISKRFLIICAVILALVLPGLYNGMKTVTYDIDSALVSSPVRIVLITDLHSCRYGKDEKKLTDAVISLEPDIILLGGDFFDDKLDSGNCESFLQTLNGRYPVYYVTGNHEYWSDSDKFWDDMQTLQDYGVIRLRGDMEILDIGDAQIAVCGIDDPHLFYQEDDTDFTEELEAVTSAVPEDVFSILLTHRPELYEEYQGRGFDLVLAGHAHGGQWRVPGLINGLFAPDQGLFPQYAGGYYSGGDTPMIVSRGLARESTLLPRLYNRPELVVIDIT